MKVILLIVAFAIGFVLADDSYTSKYDNMNIEEILANKRLLGAYTKCVLDMGKCTPEGKELKLHISDALQTGCSKCTGAQRVGMRKVIKHMINKEPGWWQEMVKKYDPKGTFSAKYEFELKKL